MIDDRATSIGRTTIVVWAAICSVAFLTCLILPLHEPESPMFRSGTPLYWSIAVMMVLGVLTGAGGMFTRWLVSEGVEALGLPPVLTSEDFATLTHVLGSFLLSAGLGNGLSR